MQIHIHPEVRAALDAGGPVVALESTLIAHGLPRPSNIEVAGRIEERVRECGAVPATIAVLDGRAHVGLDEGQLRRVAAEGMRKLSERDLAIAAATGIDGATTVAATAALANRAGIAVFATGGLGGVHRESSATWDVSADLTTLARTPIVVVCAGVKSILDVAATLERLETLGVPVVGYRSDRLAGFYLRDAGHPVPWRLDDPAQIAAVHRAQRALDVRAGLVVAHPLPADEQLEPQLHDGVLAEGVERAAAAGVRGAALTPFLLSHFHEATGGVSLEVNIRLVLRNAELAAAVAGALAA